MLESWVDDPLVQAVERASRAGLVVVTSAGNWGTLPDGTKVRDGITSPGNAPSAITVGAIDTMGTATRSDDRVADWSSRGLTAIDGFLKPDLAAPGLVGDEIDPGAALLGIVQVQCRRDDLMVDGENGEDRLYAACRTQQMPDGRFRRRYRQPRRRLRQCTP